MDFGRLICIRGQGRNAAAVAKGLWNGNIDGGGGCSWTEFVVCLEASDDDGWADITLVQMRKFINKEHSSGVFSQFEECCRSEAVLLNERKLIRIDVRFCNSISTKVRPPAPILGRATDSLLDTLRGRGVGVYLGSIWRRVRCTPLRLSVRRADLRSRRSRSTPSRRDAASRTRSPCPPSAAKTAEERDGKFRRANWREGEERDQRRKAWAW
eukprot:4890226-Pleurochrysis_carterae.AAC.2